MIVGKDIVTKYSDRIIAYSGNTLTTDYNRVFSA